MRRAGLMKTRKRSVSLRTLAERICATRGRRLRCYALSVEII
jgi:hypothetical protein